MSNLVNWPSVNPPLAFQSYTLKLTRKSTQLRSPFTGKRQAVNFAYALWVFSGKFSKNDLFNAGALRSFLMQLEGQNNKFRFPLPEVSVPLSGYTDIAPHVNGAGQTGKSLNINFCGGAVGSVVLKAGDYFTVNDELKIVTQDCLIGTSGTATVNFEPALRSSPPADCNLLIGNEINILNYSEQIDNTVWFDAALSVSANALTNPVNGATTADLIIPSTSNTLHGLDQAVVTIPNKPYTFSIYVKANSYKNVGIKIAALDGSNQVISAEFDTTGTVHSTVVSSGGAIALNQTLIPISSGWYRISITGQMSASQNSVQMYIADNSWNYTWSADGTHGIYAYGAQLEQNTVATAYRLTTTGEGVPTIMLTSSTDDTASWDLSPPILYDVQFDCIECVE